MSVGGVRIRGIVKRGGVIEAGWVHEGRCDGDDVELVADAVMDAAFVAEPDVTAKVQIVAAATGGVVERREARLKTRSSVLAKLARFEEPTSPRFRLASFNDALRYTIVYADLIYWRAAEAALGELRSEGWSVKSIARGWRPKGYKGLNVTAITPAGFHFEVQLHTAFSLNAAERTHRIYEHQRDVPFRSPRWRELERIQQEVWLVVPTPPGRLELR